MELIVDLSHQAAFSHNAVPPLSHPFRIHTLLQNNLHSQKTCFYALLRIRRSSIGFHRHHPSSDKEAMDRFLVALAGGVHVRRHQGYRYNTVCTILVLLLVQLIVEYWYRNSACWYCF